MSQARTPVSEAGSTNQHFWGIFHPMKTTPTKSSSLTAICPTHSMRIH